MVSGASVRVIYRGTLKWIRQFEIKRDSWLTAELLNECVQPKNFLCRYDHHSFDRNLPGFKEFYPR